MSILIRLACPDDAQSIHKMITDLARYEGEEHSVKVTAADLHNQLGNAKPPFQCIIAEADGQAAGFALYFFTYSTWEGCETLYLEDLFVDPQFRGEGVGVQLMAFLAKIASERACSRFEWSVLDWNESAIGFYHRIGASPITGWTRYRLDGSAISQQAQTNSPGR